MSDVTRVDRHNYPAIFLTCCTILQDNGGVNRDTPDVALLKFLLPAHPASGFGHMEAALLAIDLEDMNTFACGEDSEAQAIAATDPDLQKLHDILNEWFLAGMPYDTI